MNIEAREWFDARKDGVIRKQQPRYVGKMVDLTLVAVALKVVQNQVLGAQRIAERFGGLMDERSEESPASEHRPATSLVTPKYVAKLLADGSTMETVTKNKNTH